MIFQFQNLVRFAQIPSLSNPKNRRIYKAAGLIRYYRGSKLVLINRDETQYDTAADLVLRDPIGQVFSQI